MPFVSQAQRRFLFAKHPDIAKRWAREYPNQGPLPQHVHDAMRRRRKKRHGKP